MKPVISLAVVVISCCAGGYAASLPEISDFNGGWQFARYGLQADGSRVAEPGVGQPAFRATASSEEVKKGNLAKAAVDGDKGTRWCAENGNPGQWLQVELLKPCVVSKADVVWEKPDGYRAEIQGSADGSQWGDLPCNARFVRVKVLETPGGNWASIREVALFDADGKALPSMLPAAELSPASSAYSAKSWRSLDLPHDWAIEGPFRADLEGTTGKRPWQGIGWYRKDLTISKADADKRIYLDFDGAMAHAEVYCNGRLAGGWPYGYASFRVDLTPHLAFGGNNLVAVRLDTEKTGSRWYPGAGIYRHVRLVKASPVHAEQWGVFVTTPDLTDSEGPVKVDVSVANESGAAADVTVKAEIFELDENGGIGKSVAVTPGGTLAVPAGKSASVALRCSVRNPKRWTAWNAGNGKPARYVARTTVTRDKAPVDVRDTRFGFRTIEFTHDRGFLLNGSRVPLQGVCMHHDLGALGAAVNSRAIERQLEILRSFGCNAIRTSHNPPAPELLEIADRMGFLIMDEAFDTWTHSKRAGDYASLYQDWHAKDLEMLVKRDRNHPSVIMWSSGNECHEQYTPEVGILRHLSEIIRSLDPTRPASYGASAPSQSAMNGTELQVDVHGMNYAPGVHGGPDFYVRFLAKPGHEKLAGYSSESSSTVSSRGEYPPVAKWQVSSYDLQQPGWGSLPDEEFAALDRAPGMCGEFVWTGFDYLGEPTPYNSDTSNLLNFAADPGKKKELEAELEKLRTSRPPSRSSYFGIVDLAGFPKDRFYLYQSRWCPDLPMAHILPHWNWQGREGEKIPVFVYTSGDEAELFLNGVSQGRLKKGRYEYRLRWKEVVYQPGELKVVSYKQGKPWATSTVKTTGAATSLDLKADRGQIRGDGSDLCFLTLQVTDASGLMVPRSNQPVSFSIEGPAEIIATDNGDPTCHESFQNTTRKAFNGMALAIVRPKKGASGTVRVTATSPGLKPATATIKVK